MEPPLNQYLQHLELEPSTHGMPHTIALDASSLADSESIAMYSVASSRTRDTDYGLYYTRRALSMASDDYWEWEIPNEDEIDQSHQLIVADPHLTENNGHMPIEESIEEAFTDIAIHKPPISDTTGAMMTLAQRLQHPSSSLGHGLTLNSPHYFSSPSFSQKPSYDITWQGVQELDEILMSEKETDEKPALDFLETESRDKNEERTSAAVLAEEGRGLIAQGDNVPIVQLQIQPDTTHLLIGSSMTPNAVPSFLNSVLPQIAHSLLALDISANFIGGLPPVLSACECLEEIDISSNPLRVLPVFLADLLNLRVLIADSTGISTLPNTLANLQRLNTISIRRNTFLALPSWLCLLPALRNLCLDGNPFQGPWKSLVNPLFAKPLTTPVYSPSMTTALPISAGAQNSNADTETDSSDLVDDIDREDLTILQAGYVLPPEEDDHTITATFLSRKTNFPPTSGSPPPPTNPPLTQTQTQQQKGTIAVPSNNSLVPGQATTTKRRNFLPIKAPDPMSLSIPENYNFVAREIIAHNREGQPDSQDARVTTSSPEQYIRQEADRARDAYMRAFRSIMAYLRDMNDLEATTQQHQDNLLSMHGPSADEQLIGRPNDSSGSSEERRFKEDKGQRAMVIREILVTERAYVKGLQELIDIYIKPAAQPVNQRIGVGPSKDTVVPALERRIVFGNIEALFSFHKYALLPALEGAAAPLMRSATETLEEDADGQLSLNVAKAVGDIFVKHAAFMRMYSSYINNFDSSIQRVRYWVSEGGSPGSLGSGMISSPPSSTVQPVGLKTSVAVTTGISNTSAPTGGSHITTSQRKRIKTYLKRCRLNPRHSQLDLEGYLMLPVGRLPRYKLLLEELLRSTSPTHGYMDNPLDRALAEIVLLANNMNEGRRESESRRKLVQWQARIRGKFPSPLVQPHRRLIMDGTLLLTRVVRKAVVSFEVMNTQGNPSTVQADCLAPELTPRLLTGILCNDLLVLCRDPSEGQDLTSKVDLWAVLRMQTIPQPASIVNGTSLRVVDNRAILYFDAPTPSVAYNWYRAINLHIPLHRLVLPAISDLFQTSFKPVSDLRTFRSS